MILVNTNAIDVGMSDHWTAVFNTLMSIAVGLGVFGDPESHVNDTP